MADQRQIECRGGGERDGLTTIANQVPLIETHVTGEKTGGEGLAKIKAALSLSLFLYTNKIMSAPIFAQEVSQKVKG